MKVQFNTCLAILVRCAVETGSKRQGYIARQAEDVHRNKAREIDLDEPILADF